MDSIKIFTSLFKTKLPEETKRDILPYINKKILQKNQVIANQNETTKFFYILLSGIIRCYIPDNKGKEHIRTLFTPITATGSLSSLINETNSDAIYDCLTECVVLECNFVEIKILANKHHSLSLIYSESLQRSFMRTEERIYELSVLNSKERYLKLKKDIPDIDNLITQYHIAAYLNITPVQLSRIRKDLYSK